MRKSLVSTFLALSLILVSLAGCGSSGAQQSTPDTAPQAPQSSEAPAASEAPAQEQPAEEAGLSGNLLWLNHSDDPKWEDLMAEQFQQLNPNVTIEIQRMSFDNYNTTLQTKIASGDAPDLFPTEGEQMRTFKQNGYLADFSGDALVSNFNADDLANVTVDGALVAIPFETNSMCVTYNKDAFAAAGIDKVPVTLTEFYAVCDQLLAAGISPIAAGFKETWCLMADMQADYITAVLGQDRDAILNLLSRQNTFAGSQLWGDEFGRVFGRFNYVSPDPFGTDWSGACDLVATGKAAMVLNGTWAIGSVREKNPDVSLGVFALPFSENAADTKLLIQAPGGGIAVYSESGNIEAAKAFVGYITTPEAGTLLAQMSQKMSLIKGAQPPEEPAWADVYAYMNGGMTFSQGSIDHNFPNEYRVAVETVVSKHLLDPNRSVDALLAELDTEFDRIAQ